MEHIFDNKDGPDIVSQVVDQIEEGEALNEIVFQSALLLLRLLLLLLPVEQG